MVLPEPVEQVSDGDFVREMLAFVAGRMVNMVVVARNES